MERRPNLKNRMARYALLFLALSLFWAGTVHASAPTGVSAAINAARKAGVSEKTINQTLALGYEYNLKPVTVTQFLHIYAKAAQKGLPIAPLVSKTKEGLIKRVPPPLIQRVLNREIANQLFVRAVASKALKRWKQPASNLTPQLVARMSKTLDMGISKEEMKFFFAKAPKAPMAQVANALEFLAALKQASLNTKTATGLVFSGLKTGFFAKTAWQVPIMVKQAKHKSISDDKIATSALGVMSGKTNLGTACKSLGIDPASLAQGPQFSGVPGASEAGGNRGEISGKSHGMDEHTGSEIGGDHGGGEAGGDHGGDAGGGAGGGHGGDAGGGSGGGHGGDSGGSGGGGGGGEAGGDHGGGEAGGGHGGGEGGGGGGGGEGGH